MNGQKLTVIRRSLTYILCLVSLVDIVIYDDGINACKIKICLSLKMGSKVEGKSKGPCQQMIG